MSKELVRHAQTELVRWAHSPSIISPDLLRKEHIGFWEKAWVYNAFIALVPIGMLLGASIEASMLISTIVFAVIFAMCGLSCLGRLVGEDHPIGREVYELSFKGRAQLCLYDRNRRRVPWNGMRMARARETDGDCPQLSVWAEPGHETVQYSILEHSRRRFGPYSVKLFTYNGTQATSTLDSPSMDDLIAKRAKLEDVAQQAEAEAYATAVKGFETKRDTLIIRR